MAQSLEVNIKTTSDVPQAMDKAKAATSGFQNQLNDIGKKFSNSFKDIALGFIAPMILVQSAISFISAAIAKAKQDAKEAYDFAVKGESKYLDQTTIKLAQDRRTREDDAKEQEMAKKARETEAEKFLEQDGMRSKVADEIGGFRGFRLKFGLDANSAEAMSKDKDVQDVIARMVNPNGSAKTAETTANTGPTGPTSFKTPEGFGNVVGVGANPVMEAMTLQLEEARKQTALLENISRGSGGGVPTDFTKSPIPSRAALLKASN
jgi:hypothetical protein